jgi:two-component system sensor histidine kinase BaeS
MRTKLFLAFIFIIFLALLSNIVFEKLIIGDFNEFIRGSEEDNIYWIMASTEGSYHNGIWDIPLLRNTIHWGLMLGYESFVEDASGNRILSASEVLSEMNPGMFKRMNSLLKLPAGVGEFTCYPLYVKGEEIGKLHVRPLKRLGSIPLREEIFRRRGREFLIISFLIAGGGALMLALLFTLFLSRPIRRLTVLAGKIASGDFSVQSRPVHRKNKDEIDKLTDSFNFMAEALRREDALRKHLTSNIAHELRTPLTIIKGNLEAVEDGIISDPGTVIENVRAEIDRIVSLVEGIEDITRAEASFFRKGESEDIDLKEFVTSVVSGMKKIVEEKGLYLKIQGPSTPVETYPEKLHIILKNLITNALKFTASGGITISWGQSRNNENGGFYLSVEDTGAGIERDDMAKIFERFHKGTNSDGKGLGLAIVKELTDVMGGEIKVESIRNQGSRFSVIFNKE